MYHGDRAVIAALLVVIFLVKDHINQCRALIEHCTSVMVAARLIIDTCVKCPSVCRFVTTQLLTRMILRLVRAASR